MINTNKLKGKMAENGFTQEKLANALGISHHTMNRKILGTSEFTVGEVVKICEILKINDVETKVNIFLS